MGLSESREANRGLGSGIWGGGGPSKSRSTPHFTGDDRDFRGGRNASTLPARTTPEDMHTYNNRSRTPAHDPQLYEDSPQHANVHHIEKAQVVRSPSLRPVPNRRSASADRRKRRSDPLLDARGLHPLPMSVDAVVNYHQAQFYNSRNSPVHSGPSSPRLTQRPRPTAIYIADDQAQQVSERTRSRSRRSHAPSQLPGSSGADKNDLSKPSQEPRRSRHLSTLIMTPQCVEATCNASQKRPEHSLSPKQSRHRKKSSGGGRRRSQASEILHGDPYVSLHYGDESLGHGAGVALQSPTQVTAWRSDQDAHVNLGQKQVAQVVIRMDGCTTTTLDHHDIANANIESVEMRKNVWFQATTSGRDRHQYPCLDNDWYSVNDGSAKSNKVSSLYMVPDYHALPIQGNVATIRPRHIRDDTSPRPKEPQSRSRVRPQSPVRPIPPRVPDEMQQRELDCVTGYHHNDPGVQETLVQTDPSHWHQEPDRQTEDILNGGRLETFTPPPPPFNSPAPAKPCVPDNLRMFPLESFANDIKDNHSSLVCDSTNNYNIVVDSIEMCVPSEFREACNECVNQTLVEDLDHTLLSEEPCSVHCGSGDSGFGDASGDSGDAFLPRNYQLVKRYLLDPMILPGAVLVPPLLDHPLLQPRQEVIGCRTKSLSLPRCLHENLDNPTTHKGMRGFRSRLRSLDLGEFPVLRLPVRNQPKLVDVLKAAQAEEEARQTHRETHIEVSVEIMHEKDTDSVIPSNECIPDKNIDASDSDSRHSESGCSEASTTVQNNSGTGGRPQQAVRESCAALLKPDIPWQPVPPSYSLYNHSVPEEHSPIDDQVFPECEGEDTIILALPRGLGAHGRPSRKAKRPSLRNIDWDSPTHSPTSSPITPISPPP
ncbi:unnamed protein product, partial [Meganyctiphanes norvegica]